METNPGWLELPLTGTNFHGPKPVRVTEILLYYYHHHYHVFYYFSADIQRAIETDDVTRGIELFMELTGLFTLLHSSSCKNLVNFAKETTLFWYKILKDKIAK